jgi:hypothetical protein
MESVQRENLIGINLNFALGRHTGLRNQRKVHFLVVKLFQEIAYLLIPTFRNVHQKHE